MNGWSSLVRQVTILCGVLALALAVCLMAIKQEVRRLEVELTQLHDKIAQEHQSIHVLRAEFSHFVEPDRLRRLAASHLGLVQLRPEQVGSFTSLTDTPIEGDTSLTNPPARKPSVVTVDKGGHSR
jgi:hypothetical protein